MSGGYTNKVSGAVTVVSDHASGEAVSLPGQGDCSPSVLHARYGWSNPVLSRHPERSEGSVLRRLNIHVLGHNSVSELVWLPDNTFDVK